MKAITLHQLQIFEVAARHLSFTRAAEELYLTQPTISMQIKQLSKSVGLPLFEQVGKRLYLTEAGQALYQTCQKIFEQLNEFEMTLADLKGLKQGRLSIGVVTTAKYFIPRLLGAFCQQYPGIDVSLKVLNRQQVLERLSNNMDDLYVMGMPPEDLDVVAQPFLENPLVVMAPIHHPLVGQKQIPWPLRLAHLALGMGVTLLLCWPWYGANWLFVLSNGWAYADTAHYYVTCAAGSLCWWTAYLRWLPLQMGPWLCPLPLLSLWGSPSRREALLWGLYGGGYLLYTLVAIKDVRFTLPLLPLLAILSAGGLAKLWRYLGERWGERALRRGVGMSLALGALALLNLGQPLAPGVAPLWKGIQMRWQGQHPQQELTRWIGSRVQPGLTATLGVLPNTELISSETLSYLAALQRWPITFRGAGQTPWPEVELALLDGFVDAPGEQGIVGPYGPAKEQIRQLLDKSPDWQQEHFDLPAVGRLSTYFPSKPRVVLQELPAAAEAVELLELQVLPEEGIPAWHLRWQGPAQDLAQTLVWARLEDPQGQVLAKRAWVVGQNRLLPYAAGSWQVEEILAWPELATKEGILHLEWQPPQGRRRSFSQPWEGSRSGKGGSLISPGDPLFLLQQAARAAAIGDLEALSLYLNAWTTLQYPTFLTDPDRVLIRQLLEGEEQWAAAQSWRERQIQSHYELALLEVALLRPQAAQRHFEQIVKLNPEDNWARAYLAFLRVFFTRDFQGFQGLRQELVNAFHPLCQKADLDWNLEGICAALLQENPAPSEKPEIAGNQQKP